MNYHVFHDSFTGDIEHSGFFDLFPEIPIEENKSRDFGRVECSFQNRWVKDSEAPTCPTQCAMTSVCQQPALIHTAVAYKRKGEEERN